jgi:hypothetical protein
MSLTTMGIVSTATPLAMSSANLLSFGEQLSEMDVEQVRAVTAITAEFGRRLRDLSQPDRIHTNDLLERVMGAPYASGEYVFELRRLLDGLIEFAPDALTRSLPVSLTHYLDMPSDNEAIVNAHSLLQGLAIVAQNDSLEDLERALISGTGIKREHVEFTWVKGRISHIEIREVSSRDPLNALLDRIGTPIDRLTIIGTGSSAANVLPNRPQLAQLRDLTLDNIILYKGTLECLSEISSGLEVLEITRSEFKRRTAYSLSFMNFNKLESLILVDCGIVGPDLRFLLKNENFPGLYAGIGRLVRIQ